MQSNITLIVKSFVLGPIVWFIEKYIFNDWSFLVSVILLIFVDAMVMSVMAFIDRKYDIITAFKSFANKTLAIIFTILATSITDLAMINGIKPVIVEWINSGFYSVLLVFFTISIMKNIYLIYPLDIIKDLLDRLDNKRKNKDDADK